MKETKKICALLLSLGLVSTAAQFHLPPMEISFKGGLATFGMKDLSKVRYRYYGPTWQGELRWNVTQHVSLGAFASTGAADFKFFLDDGTGEGRNNGGHSTYGGSIRLSTGRKPRFRPFLEVSLGKFKVHYIDATKTNIEGSGNFVGGTLGLMIKASKNVYVTLPQITIRSRKEHFDNELQGDYYDGLKGLVDIFAVGLNINFGKRG